MMSMLHTKMKKIVWIKLNIFLKMKELDEIAKNGMIKCLSNHTVKNRCELIKEVLEKKL